MRLEEMVLKSDSKPAKRERIFIEEYSKRLVKAVEKGDIKTANEAIEELRKSTKQLEQYITTKKQFDKIVQVIPSKKFFEKKLEGMI
ncbi:hypothetical protein [Bacillus atrophaeus]|uniref:hypothetical protein n=1 Tax=Bacillus atrophaeus TaxID=1452 RepID=UPI002DBFE9FC|nr:hypothetical protein [Bacillus atrophaeus]MEC0935459.1 hypothetical protein [Bacillus atrophaeus]